MFDVKESFRWLAPEAFKIYNVGRNKVQLKGVALKRNVVSKNKRHYVEKELYKRGSTLSRQPLTVNHSPYHESMEGFDPTKIIGHIDYADYDEKDGTLEYLALVNKQPYVNMLRNKDPRIHGVSVEADYLYNRCVRCGEKFYDNDTFYEHLKTRHLIKNVQEEVKEPHGITFRALSLVVSPELPGVDGTTTELWETYHIANDGGLQLLETVTNDRMEMETLKKKIQGKAALTKVQSTTIHKAKQLAEQQDPATPTAEPVQADMQVDQPECPEGSHHDPETGGCIPDEIPAEDAAIPAAPATPSVASEQTECPEGFTYNEESGECEPKEWTEQPTSEPAPVPTVEPPVAPLTEQESGTDTSPMEPFPTEPPTPPAELTQDCPEGSTRDPETNECVPDSPVPLLTQPVTVEFKLPTLLSLGEPFADYSSHADCVAKNPDKEDPDAYCADIKRKVEGESFKETSGNIYSLLKEMDRKSYVRDMRSAETTNSVIRAQAKVMKTINNIPAMVHRAVLRESKLRAKSDILLRRQVQAIPNAVQKVGKALMEYQQKLAQQQTRHFAGLVRGLSECSRKSDGRLATHMAKIDRENKRYFKELNGKVTSQKHDFEKLLNVADENAEKRDKTIKSLEQRVKEQEDELKKHDCPEDQHYDKEQEKCVPNEPAAETKRLKETVDQLQTKVENLESKQKGNFKGKQPALEKQGDEYHNIK